MTPETRELSGALYELAKKDAANRDLLEQSALRLDEQTVLIASLRARLTRLEIHASRAADFMAEDAEALKESHTVDGDWRDEEHARLTYNDMMDCVEGIRGLLKS